MKKYFAVLLVCVMGTFSCNDKVRDFAGFTQSEMEYLLAADSGKQWVRIGRTENGESVALEGCDFATRLIFLQDGVGVPKPLLAAYNPDACDSLSFCNVYPAYCRADSSLCAQNPELCDSIAQNEFFIGSWLAQEPFVENSRADTLLLEIDGVEEAVQVLEISGSFASFLFKEREGSAGAKVVEHYQYQPDSN
jgi:hypothetical protein